MKTIHILLWKDLYRSSRKFRDSAFPWPLKNSLFWSEKLGRARGLGRPSLPFWVSVSFLGFWVCALLFTVGSLHNSHFEEGRLWCQLALLPSNNNWTARFATAKYPKWVPFLGFWEKTRLSGNRPPVGDWRAQGSWYAYLGQYGAFYL